MLRSSQPVIAATFALIGLVANGYIYNQRQMAISVARAQLLELAPAEPKLTRFVARILPRRSGGAVNDGAAVTLRSNVPVELWRELAMFISANGINQCTRAAFQTYTEQHIGKKITTDQFQAMGSELREIGLLDENKQIRQATPAQVEQIRHHIYQLNTQAGGPPLPPLALPNTRSRPPWTVVQPTTTDDDQTSTSGEGAVGGSEGGELGGAADSAETRPNPFEIIENLQAALHTLPRPIYWILHACVLATSIVFSVCMGSIWRYFR